MTQPRTRGNGEGSVYCITTRKRPWVASVVIGWTPSGRPSRRIRTAATQEEAERLRAMMSAGVIPPPAGARKLVPETRRQAPPSRHSRGISPSVRFLVLQRDGFACTYCGRRPPEVQLEIDHIIAYTKDGANDPVNYTTACRECNAGKRDRPL